MAKDMRTYMAQLEKAGEMIHVPDPVNVEWDIGRRLFESRERALLFENIKNYPGWKALGQAPANMRQIGIILDTIPGKVVTELARRLDKGGGKCVSVQTGPVKEQIWTGEEASLDRLPIHVIAEKDPGRYIAGGLCVVKDPETGIRNMAFHRLQVKDGKKMGIFMVEGRHTWHIYQKYEALNKPMPFAVVIGHHPMYYFAAAYTGPLGLDELEIASSLLEEPVEIVPCSTIDLEVPAHAEIILEGEIPPRIREEEGPFSEFTGYYGGKLNRPIVLLKAITLRKEAIYKAVQSAALTESIFYNGLPMAVAIFRDLRQVAGYVNLKDVSCNWGSTFNVVVQMTPRFYGEAKQVLLAAVSSLYSHQKVAVAVDEDVDIYDPQDVAWAIATRVNPEVDVAVIPGVRGHTLDNSLPEVTKPGLTAWHRLGSRMIIDATKPPTSDPLARIPFERVRPPSPRQG